ncbi:uncharacterized protein LOC134542713 isoform X1 [Bacillus rossius redtenbacheri]|uniref:uncharacterized protein LOC134542713 isoform X1 n=1 Tax=Bacillus rossius redtenbacheri TaxID=93214 RepID=UPI002FDE2330
MADEQNKYFLRERSRSVGEEYATAQTSSSESHHTSSAGNSPVVTCEERLGRPTSPLIMEQENMNDTVLHTAAPQDSTPTTPSVTLESLMKILLQNNTEMKQSNTILSEKLEQNSTAMELNNSVLTAKLDEAGNSIKNLEHSIEIRLSQQHEEIQQIAEQVSQYNCRVDGLESHVTSLRNMMANEHRGQANAREEVREHIQHLESRLSDIEVATATLRDRFENLSVQPSPTAASAGSIGQAQASECHGPTVPTLSTTGKRQGGTECYTEHQPQEQSRVTPITHRPSSRTFVNTSSMDPATLIHHPAKHWAEAMPTFSGRVTENPIRFLKRFEEYAATFNLSEAEVLKCLNSALKGQAFYWWEMLSATTSSYNHFQAMFRQQYWSLRIQSNLRAQLHTERYDPRKGTTLEAHLSTMFEKTRYLDLPMTDEEFVAAILTQLPLRYQKQLSGLTYRDITEFRERLLNYDKLEKMDRTPAPKEDHERVPQQNRQPPLNNYWQNRDNKPRDNRQAAVHTMTWQPKGREQSSYGRYTMSQRKGPYNKRKTWWSNTRNYHSDEEMYQRKRKDDRNDNRRRSYSPEVRPPRESRDRRPRSSSEDEREYARKYRKTEKPRYQGRHEETRMPPHHYSPQTTENHGGQAYSSQFSGNKRYQNATFPPPFQAQHPGHQAAYYQRGEVNPVAAEFKAAVSSVAGPSNWNHNEQQQRVPGGRANQGTLN